MLVVRSRPKFIDENVFLNSCLTDDSEELFFNYGRSALYFLLTNFKQYYNKVPVVGIQSFNCSVVIDAILQSGCKALLTDIKLSDFSISLEEVKQIGDEIDILLLTHYQGIPNSDYIEIIEYCRDHSICVVDDVSQTENSYINDVLVGSLGDFSIHSFSFDKPFTCLFGGSLKYTDTTDLFFRELLNRSYKELDIEANSDKDIETLKFLLENTSLNRYNENVGKITFVSTLIRRGFSQKLVSLVCRNDFFFKIVRRLISKSPNSEKVIIPQKLGRQKIDLVLNQRQRFVHIPLHDSIKAFFNDDRTFSGCKISWNRYSIIDRESKFKEKLLLLGIECGNFNWSKTLEQLYAKEDCVITTRVYKNSDYCSNNILNIPIWYNIENLLYE